MLLNKLSSKNFSHHGGNIFYPIRLMQLLKLLRVRSSPPGVFLEKGVLKICSKFTEEHPFRSVISMKLLYNFIEISLLHGCSPVNMMDIFKNTLFNIVSIFIIKFK